MQGESTTPNVRLSIESVSEFECPSGAAVLINDSPNDTVVDVEVSESGATTSVRVIRVTVPANSKRWLGCTVRLTLPVPTETTYRML